MNLEDLIERQHRLIAGCIRDSRIWYAYHRELSNLVKRWRQTKTLEAVK